VRRQLVVHAVAGQEGDPPIADRPDGDRRRRRAVGRVDRHLDDVVEEGVEARAAEHPDLGRDRSRGHEAAAGVLDDEEEESLFVVDEEVEDEESLFAESVLAAVSVFDESADEDEDDDDFDDDERLSVL
jgi:hypothetical protein